MFTLVRRCAESITQLCQLKVKVTVQGHGFEPWILCPFLSPLPLGGFSLNFGQMFTCGMMCRTRNSAMKTIPLEGFSFNFGQMFASVKWCAEPIAQPCRLTRWQFKVMGLSLEFCVRSVSPLPLGGFSLYFGRMFTSVGQCAEPITQTCRLKVKVTVEGHKFEPWIWCRIRISFTPGRIFFKPWSNVCLSEMMCRTLNWAMLTQGQGHTEGHQFEPWILKRLLCHSKCLVKFGSNVRLSEMMCRTYNSTMQAQGQGHNWRSFISFLFAPYLLNPLKDFHETLVKCLP